MNAHDDFLIRRRRLLALARRLLPTAADAEDLVQEAWLRWRNLDRHALREPQAWLTTVARRLAIDHRRAAVLHAERLALLGAGGDTLAPAADQEAAQNEAVRQALAHIIRRLSPAETALVLLHEVFDADHADIAAAWRRSEPACRQALRRALQRVRRRNDPPDPRDTCTESALLSLCVGALAARSAAPLFSLLREASIEAAAPPLAGRVVRGPAARTTLVQAGGVLAQVHWVDGVAVCVVPLLASSTL